MKRIIPILILSIVVFCFASCQSNDSVPPLKYETQYPATAQEYNTLINQKIVPFLNVTEGHSAKGRDVLKNKYPAKEELTSLEDTINYVNEIYESCKVIYPPDSEKQRHSDTLMQMKRIINALEVYKEKLEVYQKDASNDKPLSEAIDILASEFANMKNMFNLVV